MFWNVLLLIVGLCCGYFVKLFLEKRKTVKVNKEKLKYLIDCYLKTFEYKRDDLSVYKELMKQYRYQLEGVCFLADYSVVIDKDDITVLNSKKHDIFEG